MSSTERSRVHRAKMKEKGFKEARNLWVRPEHEKVLKQTAKRLREVDAGTDVEVGITITYTR